MTYIKNNQSCSCLFDNSSSQALNGDLNLFETNINAKSFYSSSTLHVEGRQLIHIGSMMTNDSDTASFAARISLTSTSNRLGSMLSQKQSNLGSSSLSMQSTNQTISLTSVSSDIGDSLVVGNLNFISIAIR
jgi:hypothetical protein